MPSYRVTAAIGLLQPGVAAPDVLPQAVAVAEAMTTVEAHDVAVVRGQARITVRFQADDDQTARRVGWAVLARLDELADISGRSVTRRFGCAGTRSARSLSASRPVDREAPETAGDRDLVVVVGLVEAVGGQDRAAPIPWVVSPSISALPAPDVTVTRAPTPSGRWITRWSAPARWSTATFPSGRGQRQLDAARPAVEHDPGRLRGAEVGVDGVGAGGKVDGPGDVVGQPDDAAPPSSATTCVPSDSSAAGGSPGRWRWTSSRSPAGRRCRS